MCGIGGWVAGPSTAGRPAPSLAGMSPALRHRGPDDSGQVRLPGATLVFRRLALLDAEGGRQPAANEQRTIWSVFNGELYNYRELHDRLVDRGHVLHGYGDSELIPHLYEEWGVDFVARLRGMFAVAVFDVTRQELFLARDPFGIKPLYYQHEPAGLFFASDARAVLATAGGGPVDPVSLWHYLSFGYVPDPLTMWCGMQKLAAGTWLRLRNGSCQLQRYWQPLFAPGPEASLTKVADAVESELRGSVAAHLLADVPVGAYLSSGVDSAAVVAIAAQQQQVKTFTIGFAGAAAGHDELVAAGDLARVFGTDHHEEVVSAAEYWAALPEIVAGQEEPLADPSAPALWFLGRAAARQVKAVLSGEGADELFAGYPIYREPHSLRVFDQLSPGARRRLEKLAEVLPDGLPGKGFLRRGATPLEQRFLGNVPLFTEAEKRRLMCGAWPDRWQPEPSYELVQPWYEQTAEQDDVTRMQTVSCATWLPSSILMKADKMSMAHSLEVRVPFLDRRVFAVASTVPQRFRLAHGQTKTALRAAARRLLPADVAARPKLGFPVPFQAWLGRDLNHLVRELFLATDEHLLDRTAVDRLLRAGGGPRRARQVWALMVYLLWHQAYSTAPARTALAGLGSRHR